MTTSLNNAHALRPAVFYGNGLSRTWFFDNPQFNSVRVDPSRSVLDPVLSWNFNSSMPGRHVQHYRYQRRIEGKFNKIAYSTPGKPESGSSERKKRSFDYDSPPTSPIAMKRKRFVNLNDDAIGSGFESMAKIIRNLSDDFEEVAGENNTNQGKANERSFDLESVGKVLKEKKTKRVRDTNSTRTSPRLAKRRSSMFPLASSKISLYN